VHNQGADKRDDADEVTAAATAVECGAHGVYSWAAMHGGIAFHWHRCLSTQITSVQTTTVRWRESSGADWVGIQVYCVRKK